jgi:membrane protein YdbS with pleckstrin-like domain
MSGVYQGLWSILAEWFRVPEEPPTLPAGETGQVESFKPATDFLRYLRFFFWIGMPLLNLPLLGLGIALVVEFGWPGWIGFTLIGVVLSVINVITFFALRLRYDTTWYAMTDHSLRLRHGVWVIREMTFTFENVQNVKIERGPIERAFGVSRVVIETAGASSGSHGKPGQISNSGVIEGIADAEKIRDLILDRLRGVQSAGLGDEKAAGGAWTAEHLDALRSIRDALVSRR